MSKIKNVADWLAIISVMCATAGAGFAFNWGVALLVTSAHLSALWLFLGD